MNDHPIRGKDASTSSIEDSSFDAAVFDTAVQQCFAKLDMLVMRLHRYPPAAVVAAMSTYLAGLVGALFDEQQCTASEVREFLREMESSILEPQDPG